MTIYETYPKHRLVENSCIITFGPSSYSWCTLPNDQRLYLLNSYYLDGAIKVDVKFYSGKFHSFTKEEFIDWLKLNTKPKEEKIVEVTLDKHSSLEKKKQYGLWALHNNIDKINDSKKLIEGVNHYLKIQNEFTDKGITEEFKKDFAYFYKLNAARPHKDYLEMYFNIFAELRDGANYSFDEISRRLYNIQEKHQFSFITKMMHTANNELPIYDSMLEKILLLGKVNPSFSLDKKIQKSESIIGDLYRIYYKLKESKLFNEELEKIKALDNPNLSFIKKCDFVFWIIGSIK